MSRPSRAPTRRALLLGFCVIAGGVAAAIGRSLTGHDAWLLAVPAAIAVGWFFVGRPGECEPDPGVDARQDEIRPRR